MSGIIPEWCPASSVTVSGMERNRVRDRVEWVSGIDRNTHVVDVGTGNRVTFRRDHPVVDGVRKHAPYAVDPDGVIVTKYDDGTYRTDDGREYRDIGSS